MWFRSGRGHGHGDGHSANESGHTADHSHSNGQSHAHDNPESSHAHVNGHAHHRSGHNHVNGGHGHHESSPSSDNSRSHAHDSPQHDDHGSGSHNQSPTHSDHGNAHHARSHVREHGHGSRGHSPEAGEHAHGHHGHSYVREHDEHGHRHREHSHGRRSHSRSPEATDDEHGHGHRGYSHIREHSTHAHGRHSRGHSPEHGEHGRSHHGRHSRGHSPEHGEHGRGRGHHAREHGDHSHGHRSHSHCHEHGEHGHHGHSHSREHGERGHHGHSHSREHGEHGEHGHHGRSHSREHGHHGLSHSREHGEHGHHGRSHSREHGEHGHHGLSHSRDYGEHGHHGRSHSREYGEHGHHGLSHSREHGEHGHGHHRHSRSHEHGDHGDHGHSHHGHSRSHVHGHAHHGHSHIHEQHAEHGHSHHGNSYYHGHHGHGHHGHSRSSDHGHHERSHSREHGHGYHGNGHSHMHDHGHHGNSYSRDNDEHGYRHRGHSRSPEHGHAPGHSHHGHSYSREHDHGHHGHAHGHSHHGHSHSNGHGEHGHGHHGHAHGHGHHGRSHSHEHGEHAPGPHGNNHSHVSSHGRSHSREHGEHGHGHHGHSHSREHVEHGHGHGSRSHSRSPEHAENDDGVEGAEDGTPAVVAAAAVPQQPLVAVAIDKDKGSQNALKWAIDNLVTRGQTITLVHVMHKSSSHHPGGLDEVSKELFLPFRCFCTRKDVHCEDVILEDNDVAKAIIEFVGQSAIEKLVVGHPSRNGLIRRFKTTDVASSVSKGAPDFCTVYTINKGKVSSVRQAVRPAPAVSALRQHIHSQNSLRQKASESHSQAHSRTDSPFHSRHHNPHEDRETIKSPFIRGYNFMSGAAAGKSYCELPYAESDRSFISSGRPSVDRMFHPVPDHHDGGWATRSSAVSDVVDSRSFEVANTPYHRHGDAPPAGHDRSFSQRSDSSWSSQTMEDVEAEMRRLKLELKQTMDMYSTACREALTAKQKAQELHRWKMEEELRLQEARLAEEAALAIAEKEKAKCKVAMEAAEAAQRIAELEAQKRVNAEMKALKEAEEKAKALDALANSDLRYRKYTIEEIEVATEYFSESRKIGEGGYGPVYKCYLDHTPVAIKVLRPDAAQGRSQFQQEVEVLSCIRHPNMVLLLGACPEYGCLVYEYMANGSLDDRLFRRGNSPVMPWQLRFRIAAEIGTGLLFLHQTKPEPLVHRDLKPGNILLDNNWVSKISDVGLSRLVPPTVADTVTQYRVTSTAGTFCYIDPEYQQTGMLGIKSDIYSLGVLLLQLVTAKSPMGLTHHVERAIEKGVFAEMLDPAVPDWPVEEALTFAKLALQCAELRRRDRPDLGAVLLPELNRLRALAEEHMHPGVLGCMSPAGGNHGGSHGHMSHSHSSCGSSKSRSSASSGRRTSRG